MAIRKIIRMGHPILRKKARELTREEILSPGLQELLKDMFDTLEDYEGIGLAAPQVQESIALAIIHYPSDAPAEIVINPRITVLDEALQGYWEGCLSIPEIRGLVYRPRKVRIDYLNLKAEPCTVTVEGFPATVYQHELDHLFGVLFVDRIKNHPGETPISFVEEYSRWWVPEEGDEVGELDD